MNVATMKGKEEGEKGSHSFGLDGWTDQVITHVHRDKHIQTERERQRYVCGYGTRDREAERERRRERERGEKKRNGPKGGKKKGG